jgi:hypothetical protein
MKVASAAVIVATTIALLSNAPAFAAEPITKSAKITLDPHGVLVVDGKKVFPITLTITPGPDAKAPSGKHAYEKFADGGAMFMRTGCKGNDDWDEGMIARERATQDAAAAHGMRCCPWLGWELANFDPGNAKREAQLKKVIDEFKNSPGMGLWKGADEPAWGNMQNAKKSTPEQCAHVAKIIHREDPDHPIWLVQAPRGTVAMLKRYNDSWDIGGIDIYPVSYPPGVHTEEKNKELSMVGDWTRMMREIAGKKPFWMTLQIAFSGTSKPGRTLRFPTFPEQRFCAYESIINGARGLVYFGGGIPVTLNARDRELGWNWTYWQKIMLPLMEEVGPKSPILPALIAPDAKFKLKVTAEKPEKRRRATKADEDKSLKPAAPGAGARKADSEDLVEDKTSTDVSAIETLARDPGDGSLYVLACKKEGPTLHVRFTGLPAEYQSPGQVVFEDPRTVEVKDGGFSDWFGPNEVHVYKFSRK